MSKLCLGLAAAALIFASGDAFGEKKKGEAAMPIEITSPAFEPGGMIPKLYSCEGRNISPPLEWTGIPKGAKSLALIADDPDAPGKTWVHWVAFNIPAGAMGLAENVPAQERLADGTEQGFSDFRRVGYGGPCPPMGTHRYLFKLYALDTTLTLGQGRTKEDLVKAMEGHILGQSELVGKYKRF